MTETDWAALLEPVARELLGDPVRRPTSGEWRYRRKGSLAVHVAGPRRGTWRDHEADVGGGVLELLAHVEGLTRPEALVWLRHRGLLDGPRTGQGRGPRRSSGRGGVSVHRSPEKRSTGLSAERRNPDRAEKRDVRLDRAVKMWERSVTVPAAADHPARRWLARRRLWRPAQPLPPSVRWVAAPGPSVGAIVAAFAPPGTGRLSGVQLIHVDADGLPALDKPGPDGLPKRSFGQMAGADIGGRWPGRWNGIEAALTWGPTAGRGKGGRQPDYLKPVRKGGPGPDVFIPWRNVLRLAGERAPDGDASSYLRVRYKRRIDAMRAAGLLVGGQAAPAGDTVEIVRVVDGRGKGRSSGIIVRATDRFVEAYRAGPRQQGLGAAAVQSSVPTGR